MKKYLPVSFFAVVLILAMGILSFLVVPGEENLLTGDVTTQVFIYESPPKGCSVNLTEGINMVSFLCVTGEKFVGNALINRSNHTLDYYAIYKYNANKPADAWDSYNPDLPNWTVQSLEHLNRRYGYVVVMNSSGEFFRDGYRFSLSDIELEEGWNFIGYPSDNELDIVTSLTHISGNFTNVEAYTPVNGTKTWLYYIPENASSTLNTMTPMVGYWIYMNASDLFYVDW